MTRAIGYNCRVPSAEEPMHAIHALPVLALAIAAALPAQQPNPQRLAFVGDRDAERTAVFVEFLKGRFAAVDVFDRASAEPAALQRADVVLLDWPQSDMARLQRAEGKSPLGKRDDWHTPTVLLGSAGLNLACTWQVRGGFG